MVGETEYALFQVYFSPADGQMTSAQWKLFEGLDVWSGRWGVPTKGRYLRGSKKERTIQAYWNYQQDWGKRKEERKRNRS